MDRLRGCGLLRSDYGIGFVVAGGLCLLRISYEPGLTATDGLCGLAPQT